MIENEAELRAAIAEAGGLIQQINDYVHEHPETKVDVRVRFPRGFLRTNEQARRSFAFVADRTLRSNISYAIMAHDVLRWIIQRTDLSGQAKEMVIKEGVCLIASICESLMIYPGEKGLGRGAGFEKRAHRLRELEVITGEALDDLLWLWGKRRHEHLFDVPIREFSHYTMDDWTRSISAYRGLKNGLSNWER